VTHVLDGEVAVPPVDPRSDMVCQEPGQSAHGEILSNDRSWSSIQYS
jgi:hypothetical protein